MDNQNVVVVLGNDGFNDLTEDKKKLIKHLSEAGLWGRVINLDQVSKYNIPFLEALLDLKNNLNKNDDLLVKVDESLELFFIHNGIYEATSGELLSFQIKLEDLDGVNVSGLKVGTIECLRKVIENKNGLIEKFRTVQVEGVDCIAQSGVNFYDGVNINEVMTYREKQYGKISNVKKAPHGFNERLSKNDKGEVVSEKFFLNGLYGEYIEKIIQELSYALDFAENEKQALSISTLIDFYKSGDPKDFDKHSEAWVKDVDSDVYFVNGFIESYQDPLGVACNFESIVAYKNPKDTAKVKSIIDNIQWFEDNLPFDKQYKKQKASGLSASSISVVSMAGSTSPLLPLGINLPNSDWVREQYGSKSVTLSNVATARSSASAGLFEEMLLPEYANVLLKNKDALSNLHVDLHEITGHGSGKTLPGVDSDSLGIYYSTIEESRADLVALYYIGDEKLKEIGIYDKGVDLQEIKLAHYSNYITNGYLTQLMRVNGEFITQAHLKNRQLISSWLLENAGKDIIELVRVDNKSYVKIGDVNALREKIGQLLGIVQVIKSTADIEGARELVEKYAVKVNADIHKEVLDRVNRLNIPKNVGFFTPLFDEESDTIRLTQKQDFLQEQIEMYNRYSLNNSPKLISKRLMK